MKIYSLIWGCDVIRAPKFVWSYDQPSFLTSVLLHNKHRLIPYPVNIQQKENSWYMKEKLAHTFQDNFRLDSSLDYCNPQCFWPECKTYWVFRKEYLLLKARLIVQPSRKASYLLGLPRACGTKVSCASLVCCGLSSHIKPPVSCSSFSRWKILPCSSVPGREAHWERWIEAQRGVQAVCIPGGVNDQAKSEFTEARQREMAKLLLWLMISGMQRKRK